MKRLGLTLTTGVLALALFGCPATTPATNTTPPPTSDPDTDAEFAALDKKVEALKKELAELKALATKPDKYAAVLARIETRLRRLERNRATASIRPRRPTRPRVNKTTVYAVPIKGSARSGPRHALVTVVMAFEFA